MTTFKSALGICGLSQQGAADYLGVSLQSVKDWSRGRSSPPIGVWEMMRDLYERIEDAAVFAVGEIDRETMPRQQMNGIIADCALDPLPEGADGAAGALALLIALGDDDGDE